MRDVLESLVAGELSLREAETRLKGYRTGAAGRFDAARERRRGLPEAILADGKTPDEVAELGRNALASTNRAVITRTTANQREHVIEELTAAIPDSTYDCYPRSGLLILHTPDYTPETLDASVGVVSAGTSDEPVAEEAAVIVQELGARVKQIADVGVANLTRITDQLPTLRDQDVLIVVAGREGALPTVVAGLVDTPVIGVPVSSGYGAGGDGEAALYGMLQSCTVLSVVNIDAGYIAGAQAGLIAQAIDRQQ